MDPMRKKKDESQSKAREIFAKLKIPYQNIGEYEQIIASEIILPDEITGTFEDIGGLEEIISTLKEAVIYPLIIRKYFDSNQLLGPPKGVLLYGPPGCGKTLIAKALAKESGATFINLHISTLTEKWYGESQKLVRALFSLAKKLQPAIIFIDEIDSFLRERHSNDHEVTGMMKAEFMSLWDGLSSSSDDRVLILGATNRYMDIDKAILRRMPKKFSIGLPQEFQRKRILEILLKSCDIVEKDFVLSRVANMTEGYSGSDLKELCRNALMLPIREYLKTAGLSSDEPDMTLKRSLNMDDFMNCISDAQSSQYT